MTKVSINPSPFIPDKFHNFLCSIADDDEVARKISEKLKTAGAQGISFCNIAKKAQEMGRNNLAIKVCVIILVKTVVQVILNLNLYLNSFWS